MYLSHFYRPTLSRLCVGVYKRTSFISSSLHLQQAQRFTTPGVVFRSIAPLFKPLMQLKKMWARHDVITIHLLMHFKYLWENFPKTESKFPFYSLLGVPQCLLLNILNERCVTPRYHLKHQLMLRFFKYKETQFFLGFFSETKVFYSNPKFSGSQSKHEGERQVERSMNKCRS